METQFKHLEQISETFGPFEVDLFASRLNNQCEVYFAWQPDPMLKQ